MNLGEKTVTSCLLVCLILTLMLASISTVAFGATGGDQIDMYVTPEAEFLPVSELISHLLESQLKVKVNRTLQYSDIGLRKTATSKADLFLGLKLPLDREVSWNYSLYQLCDLGPIYEDVIAGWAVPAFIPKEELGSVTDLSLPKVKERLHREIVGYQAEGKLLEKSRKIMEHVKGLEDYTLVETKQIAAISELRRAIYGKEWIVMTLKRPSVPYSIYETRFIAELTDEQSVHLFARTNFMAKYSSEITQFLSRFYLSIDLVDEMIRLYDEHKASAARKFAKKHPALVNYWLNGWKTG